MSSWSLDSVGKTRTYRLDAAMLSPEKRAKESTPELERETHDIIERRVQEFKSNDFAWFKSIPHFGRWVRPILQRDDRPLMPGHWPLFHAFCP